MSTDHFSSVQFGRWVMKLGLVWTLGSEMALWGENGSTKGYDVNIHRVGPSDIVERC